MLIDGGKHHVDGKGGFILVLHLGLGQRRGTDHTPVNRLIALHQMAAFGNFTEGANNIGLVLVVNTQIGIVPFTENTEANKVFLLPLNLAQSIVATLLTKGLVVNFGTGLAVLLFHLMFDG